MDLQKLADLKRLADDANRKADRAAGVVDQLKEQLKKDFGCKTLEEANALLLRKKKEAERDEREYEEALEDFEKKWADKLR